MSVRKTTEEARKVLTTGADKKKELEENASTAEGIMTSVVMPALEEIKAELAKTNAPAEVLHSRSNKGSPSVGSITIRLDKLVPIESDEPAFHYNVTIRASSVGVEYSRDAFITSRRGEKRRAGSDMRHINVYDLKREDVAEDFAAQYRQAAEIIGS